MGSNEELLTSLEALMNDFFSPCTTNDRKREIENLLNNFKQQQNAWSLSLWFLNHSNNDYVRIYCLTTLEYVVNRKWLGLETRERVEIRSSLEKFLLETHLKAPLFMKNKLVKLIVDIARMEWPHFYPDFYTNMLQMLQYQDTVPLGLKFLQMTSEELGCPREDLYAARKEELRKLLVAQIPQTLNALTVLLEGVLDKHKHRVTATPPPSPIQGNDEVPDESMEGKDSLMRGILKNRSEEGKNLFWTLPPLDPDTSDVCKLALQVLAHLFSWIPLSNCISSNLLHAIFQFASFGTDPRHMDSKEGDCMDEPLMGETAMNAINEIVGRNCVPGEFQDLLLEIFRNTFNILQRLLTEESLAANLLQQIHPKYLEKFTDFLRLFVSIHFTRFESHPNFPVMEFLDLLFKFTFHQPTNDGFFACLETWHVFLDCLSTVQQMRHGYKTSLTDRYREAYESLTLQVLHKIQFRYNQPQLEEMDDESLDENEETEWQHFLRQGVELIAKVAELLPDYVFSAVLYPLDEALQVYFKLETAVVNEKKGEEDIRRLTITAEQECRKLHCLLRDLSSFLQAAGRMSEFFIGENFQPRLPMAEAIVNKIAETAQYGSRLKLFQVQTAVKVLKSDFAEAHAQSFAALKAWSHWLAQFYGESLRNPDHADHQRFQELLTSIVTATVPMISVDMPDKVMHSSLHLLNTITSTVRPAKILDMELLHQLYQHCPSFHLPRQDRLLLYRAMMNSLILPWPGNTDQQWEVREQHIAVFVRAITGNFLSLKHSHDFNLHSGLQDRTKEEIKQTVWILGDQAENIAEETTRTKAMLFSAIHLHVSTAIQILPAVINIADVSEELLGFFLVLFRVLRTQMGPSLTQQTLETLLGAFSKEHMAEAVMSKARVVERFLRILELVMQEPGSAFQHFIPSTLSLCLEHIYPSLADKQSDVKGPLYDVLTAILVHHHKYFFKTNILTSLGAPGSEILENETHFSGIMSAFIQSFQQDDISLFRQNLEALEKMNAKWKLFHKEVFCQTMAFPFLSSLLHVLAERTHDLVKEEIAICMHNIASAMDFSPFFDFFLPHFLNEKCSNIQTRQRAALLDHFRREQDLPTFTWNLHQFVNDLRYYQVLNSGLPPSAVTFA